MTGYACPEVPKVLDDCACDLDTLCSKDRQACDALFLHIAPDAQLRRCGCSLPALLKLAVVEPVDLSRFAIRGPTRPYCFDD